MVEHKDVAEREREQHALGKYAEILFFHVLEFRNKFSVTVVDDSYKYLASLLRY